MSRAPVPLRVVDEDRPPGVPAAHFLHFGMVPITAAQMRWEDPEDTRREERFSFGDFKVWPAFAYLAGTRITFPDPHEVAELADVAINAVYGFLGRLERSGLVTFQRSDRGVYTGVRFHYTTNSRYHEDCRREVEKERIKRGKYLHDGGAAEPEPLHDGGAGARQDGGRRAPGRAPLSIKKNKEEKTLRSLAREESESATPVVEPLPAPEPELSPEPEPVIPSAAPIAPLPPPLPAEPDPTPEQLAAWQAAVADKRTSALHARLDALGHLTDHKARVEARAAQAACPPPTPRVASLTTVGPPPPPPTAPPVDHTAADCETLFRRLPSLAFRAEVPAIVEELGRRLADRWDDWHSLANHRKILRAVAAGTIPLKVALAAFKAGCSATGRDHPRLYQAVITAWRQTTPRAPVPVPVPSRARSAPDV